VRTAGLEAPMREMNDSIPFLPRELWPCSMDKILLKINLQFICNTLFLLHVLTPALLFANIKLQKKIKQNIDRRSPL
jgi:hypothetical protein